MVAVRRTTESGLCLSYVIPTGFGRARRWVRSRRWSEVVEGVACGPLFDEDWYMRTYPDVRISGLGAVDHFARYGLWENRDPSPLFSSRFYARQAGAVRQPLIAHYLNVGDREGLMPNPLFDTQWYREHYDVGSSDFALVHYLEHEPEGTTRPNPLFDPTWFAAAYASDVPAGRGALRFYLEGDNFLRYRPSEFFDPAWYRANTPDACGQIPLAHYLAVGITQGASPHPWVDGDLLAEAIAMIPTGA